MSLRPAERLWFACSSFEASRSTRSASFIQLSNQADCAAGSFLRAEISFNGRHASSTSEICPPRFSAPITARFQGYLLEKYSNIAGLCAGWGSRRSSGLLQLQANALDDC